MRPLRIFGFLLFFFFLCHNTVNAQRQLSDFLLAAFEDINTEGFTAAENFIRPSNYRIPAVDEVELRFSNDEFTNEEQQYALRITPSNPWEIRRNKALFNATRKEIGFQKKLVFKENLYQRYIIASNYLFDLKFVELEQERFSLVRKRVNIVAENAESSFFDSKDFVKAKLDQIDKLYDLQDQQSSLLLNKRTITSLLKVENLDWENETLVSVSTIDSLAKNIIQQNLASTELDLLVQKLDVARKKTRLEKADFKIGFAQVEYFPFKNKESDYGISFGISLPLFSPNKSQIAERILDEIEIKNEIQSQQFQDSVQRVIQYQFLIDLLHHHQLLDDQILQIDIPSLTNRLSVTENNNPVVLLDIEDALIKLKLLRLESHQRIVEQYIEFLYAFDMLTEVPLTNYLSEELEFIK